MSKTLVEILCEVKDFEWPEGARYCVQSSSGRITFGAGRKLPKFNTETGNWTNFQHWNYTSAYDFITEELAVDYDTSIVKKEQFNEGISLFPQQVIFVGQDGECCVNEITSEEHLIDQLTFFVGSHGLSRVTVIFEESMDKRVYETRLQRV